MFWRKGNPDEKREHDVILNEFNACVRYEDYVRSRGRRDVSGDRVTTQVTNLWPFSNIQAVVLVLNGAKTGAYSDVIDIVTPEGCKGLQ